MSRSALVTTTADLHTESPGVHNAVGTGSPLKFRLAVAAVVGGYWMPGRARSDAPIAIPFDPEISGRLDPFAQSVWFRPLLEALSPERRAIWGTVGKP